MLFVLFGYIGTQVNLVTSKNIYLVNMKNHFIKKTFKWIGKK